MVGEPGVKILVASAFQADSNYAHAINTIKMADGFAKLGHEVLVTCLAAKISNIDEIAIRQKFGLTSQLHLHFVRPLPFLRSINHHEYFAWKVKNVAQNYLPDIAYCRHYLAPVFLSRMGIPTVAESHAHIGSRSRYIRKMISGLKNEACFIKLITISPMLARNFEQMGCPTEKIQILPDAVDLQLFERPFEYQRTPRESPVVLYAGHLYDYKGIPEILGAAALLPEMQFKLLGGHPEDIDRVSWQVRSMGLKNVELLGWVSHVEVPQFLWDSDVLLLPPSANHPSAEWTSPVKLGEYLASRTPIVATAIPALRFWLKNKEVHFVKPDSASDLAQGIRFVLNSKEVASDMAMRALSFASTVSYEQRCGRVLK